MLSAEKAASDILLFLQNQSGVVEPDLEIIDTQIYSSPPSPQTEEPSSPVASTVPKGKGKTVPEKLKQKIEKASGKQKRKRSVPKPRRSLDTVCI